MTIQDADATMAVFLDLENIALGARDAHYPSFDIQKVLERLLLKGHIVVKKAYCDFDLCYTKGHVDTFVIISGDSDFSPLVSKLRENAKTVIGMGVKNSTADLFINNCDEFLYYDDLVRVAPSKASRRRTATVAVAKPAEGQNKGPTLEKAFDILVETLE